MKSSKGLDSGNFGEIHYNILREGNPSILLLKPGRKGKPLDREAYSPFLPHLVPGTNPILQHALSPVGHGRYSYIQLFFFFCNSKCTFHI